MHHGKTNAKFIYHIRGNLLNICKTYKDLGVMISDDSKVTAQMDRCITKANSMVGLIKRTFSYIDSELFLRVYKTFVRPILEYCQQVWACYMLPLEMLISGA